MLSDNENELITRTGRGSPMGEMLRRYWHPAVLSSELPGPDCDPVRVRILQEDLVAFRDSVGRVGLLDARCPHRGASLFWGRNEDCGLRCVYHGWKFDVDGQCIDMPSEPEESQFMHKVRAKSYSTHESGGLIWAYIGPPDLKPPFPGFEFNALPPSQVLVSKWMQESNFFQAFEGGIDSSHLSFLHRQLQPVDWSEERYVTRTFLAADTRPRFFTADTDVGLMVGARRNFADDQYYWRVTQVNLPYFCQIPKAGYPRNVNFWVPFDDENCWAFSLTWNCERPFSEEDAKEMTGTAGIHIRDLVPGTWMPRANKDNDFLIDRQKQRTQTFTGIRQVPIQDAAVQTSMRSPFDGTTIQDRTAEHLGASDIGIIKTRQRVLTALKAFQAGAEPPGVDHPQSYGRLSAEFILSRDVPWEDVVRRALEPGSAGVAAFALG